MNTICFIHSYRRKVSPLNLLGNWILQSKGDPGFCTVHRGYL